MTEKEKQDWEENRAQGKTKFVLSQGIAFGVIMAVVTGIMYYIMDQENPDKIRYILFQSAFWIPGGFLYSLWLWWYSERRYKKSK